MKVRPLMRALSGRIALTLIGCVVVVASSVRADERVPPGLFRSDISGDRTPIRRLGSTLTSSSPYEGLSESIPLRIGARVRGEGMILVRLTEARAKNWRSTFSEQDNRIVEDPAPIVLMRGGRKRALGTAGERVAGALFSVKGRPVLRINFLGRRRAVAYQLDINPGTLETSIHRRPLRAVSKAACALKDSESGAAALALPHVSGPATAAAEPLRILEVATEADREFVRIHGSASNSVAAAMLNSADVIYRDQLNLTIQIVGQHSLSGTSNPYPSTESSTLLKQFRSTNETTGVLPAADVYHLFTGKNLDENVIGLAFLGVVCVSPASSYSLSQFIDTSITFITSAHEIGHNLSAPHDVATNFIMSAVLKFPIPTMFSPESRDIIAAHVARYGPQCLAVSGVQPTPSPTATPDPDATPGAAPTPAPTATPRGGGGGGGGGGGSGTGGGTEQLVASAIPYLKPSGKFRIDISVAGDPNGCSLTVTAGSKRTGRGSDLVSIPFATKRTRYFSTVSRATSGNEKTAYFQARLDCGARGVVRSIIRNVDTSKVKLKGKSVPIKTWLAELKSNGGLVSNSDR